MIRVEHLHFVDAHQEDTTVAPLLTFAVRGDRRHPLDVELHVAEFADTGNVASAGGDFHIVVGELPARRLAAGVGGSPATQRLAAEEHDRIRRRSLHRARRAGVDDRRLRARQRMNGKIFRRLTSGRRGGA